MSTVPPQSQPQLPKGCRLSRKMKRLIFFIIFFGLFTFAMNIFITQRIHHGHHHHGHHRHQYHYSDQVVYELAEEIRQLKADQYTQREWIETIYQNQGGSIKNQGNSNKVQERLIHEISRVEAMVVESQRAYHNMQVQLQQQDQTIKALARNMEVNKAYNTGNPQERSQVLAEVSNNQRELSNRLEAFRGVLQGFETKMNNNNQRIAEEIREIKRSVSSVSNSDVEALHGAYINNQKHVLNEINTQKNIVNQVSQNQMKQANEVKEVNKVLNNLRDYTLEAVQKLVKDNMVSENRLSNVEKSRVSTKSNGKGGSDVSALANDLNNFREYTMEALQEIRNQHNKNTKKINHIENEALPVSDLVSQEVQKFLSSLSDGQLVNKILAENNISMRDVETLANIAKMITSGDVDGLLKAVNHLSQGKFDNVLKYASWFIGPNASEPKKVTPNHNNNQGQRRVEEPEENILDDIFAWF